MSNPVTTVLRSPGSVPRQLVLAGAAVLLLSLLGFVLWWVLRPDYQVLFTELKPADAATFAAELEKRKLKFRFADGERTLLVAGEDPRLLRMKLMSQDLPVKGGVGFELFNNSSFGLTEFAQKVNYQRALQGELARTISSLADIEGARVHLSIPESAMFRRAGNRPKASVAVTMRGGAELEAATVRGIQRLVAASVPELEIADVTVLDARGAPAGRGGGLGLFSDAKLELKIEIEQYYARKVLDQLEPVVGAGKVSVSVDAQLNHDQTRITQESSSSRAARPQRAAPVAPAPSDGAAATVAEVPSAAPVPSAESGARRVEQIVAETGSLRRLAIGVQLQGPQDAAQVERLKAFVATVVGLNLARGDALSVLVRESPLAPTPPVAVAPEKPTAPATAAPGAWGERRVAGEPTSLSVGAWWALAVIVVAIMLLPLWWTRRRARAPLSAQEQALLAQRLKSLLAQPETTRHVDSVR